MRRVNRYEHVIWDWNGTLLNDVALCLDVMNGMLRRRTMREIDSASYREVFDFPVRDYYRRLGFDFAAEPFEQLAIEYCEEYDSRVSECVLHRDAVRVINAIGTGAAVQSVLSSCEQRALETALGGFDLFGRFEQVIGQSNRHATGKLEAGRALIQDSRIAVSSTVLIGDTLHDYEVARDLGVACILVANGHHSRRRLEAVHKPVVDAPGLIASVMA